MQLRWTAPLIIGTAVMALVPAALAAKRLKQKGAWRPTNVVQLNDQWPLCPVDLSRKTPTKPVRTGRKLSTSVQVINTGATPLNALNVQVGLPSDICVYKKGKRHLDTWRIGIFCSLTTSTFCCDVTCLLTTKSPRI